MEKIKICAGNSDLIDYSKQLHTIFGKIQQWNYEDLYGMGFYRGHDKYAFIELRIHNSPNNSVNTNTDSYLDWKVDIEQFPIDVYNYGKNELFFNAQSVINFLSAVKGKVLSLTFDIHFAGYGPTDAWGRGAVGQAFINAIKSCFDAELYKVGLDHKDIYHPCINGTYQSIFGQRE